jgi:hypothetical protein
MGGGLMICPAATKYLSVSAFCPLLREPITPTRSSFWNQRKGFHQGPQGSAVVCSVQRGDDSACRGAKTVWFDTETDCSAGEKTNHSAPLSGHCNFIRVGRIITEGWRFFLTSAFKCPEIEFSIGNSTSNVQHNSPRSRLTAHSAQYGRRPRDTRPVGL